ncbi:MAG: hypothetical protein GY896_08855 [Gammaproteobacteria bacterium]|nr:hypothetical protein [Gammaproteobacteria bacterium]
MILEISSEPIGVGQERACYRHPQDPDKVVKIQKTASDKQTRRELTLYDRLARRGMTNFEHIPQYYGRLQNYSAEMMREIGGSPKTIEAAYRRQG